MSIIRKVSALVAVYALTVMAPGHAEDVVEKAEVQLAQVTSTLETKQSSTIQYMYEDISDKLQNFIGAISTPWIDFSFTEKDVDCLARNIYYEAGGEPEEGKVAVAMVTINRVRSGNFGNTICKVVNQRTTVVYSTVVKNTEIVQRGGFGGVDRVVSNRTVINYVPVCQFSWVCAFIRKPAITNPGWIESQEIAKAVLAGDYDAWGAKYSRAIYFHSTGVRPGWAQQKVYLNRIGGHIFYAEKI